jgi:hypothetical protein
MIALAGVVALPAAAFAGIDLPTGFDVVVTDNNGSTWTLSNNPDDVDGLEMLPNGNMVLFGNSTVFGAGLEWTFELGGSGMDNVPGTPRGGAPVAFLSSAFTVTNTSMMTDTFVVTATTPVSAAGPLTASGSVSGSVGDSSGGDGATVSSLPGSSLYEAFIDSSSIATLLDDPFSQSAPAFATSPFGPGNFSGLATGGVSTDIAITNVFELTQGDNASFTSTLVLVPTPGALGLLGVAGLAMTRRRR